MAVDFVHFPTPRKAADALYNELRRYIGDAPGYHDEHGAEEDVGPPRQDTPLARGDQRAGAPYIVMLAGGQSPFGVYQRLTTEPPRHVHPAVALMVSDDRLVPESDERSNAGRLRPLAAALELPDDRLIHIPVAAPAEAAQRFHEAIADLRARNAHLAVAVLGIGGDGHTASLFGDDVAPMQEGENLAAERRPSVADGTIPSEGPYARATGVHGDIERVSASESLLLAFRRLIFFAPGHAKHDILYQLSRRPEEVPAGRIMLRHPNAEIWSNDDPQVV